MMWLFIFVAVGLLSLLGFAYVVTRLTRFRWIQTRLPGKRGILFSLGLLVVVFLAFSLWGGLWTAMVVFIHLLVIWLLCDLVALVAHKLTHRKATRYVAGGAALGLTLMVTMIGIFFAHHVYRTAYTVPTEGHVGGLRVVAFSDSHVGTTFHADRFASYVDRMQTEQPDVVVIVGDFVDDSTSLADMTAACEALGRLSPTYGVYYVFGNHDCGYAASLRGCGKQELVDALERNGVTVLEDAVVHLTDDIYLIGRQDTQQKGRATMQELTGEVPAGSRTIVLDHEPNDQAAQAQSGVDLVLSGHTHGGQFWPIRGAGVWMGQNDMTYGLRKEGNTTFIVSSGIADWALRMKTGCLSEYLVVDFGT